VTTPERQDRIGALQGPEYAGLFEAVSDGCLVKPKSSTFTLLFGVTLMLAGHGEGHVVAPRTRHHHAS
jgi:hypothetical protein